MVGFHVMAGAEARQPDVEVRRIGFGDVADALRLGFEDFWEKPSHYVFLCLIYPIAGVVLGTWAAGANALPLIFPLVSGFALLGPLAALPLYEISRRREAGLDTSWRNALALRRSPAIPSILLVGAMLLAIFLVWMLVAQALYISLFGVEPPASAGAFLAETLTTAHGWTMIVAGNAIGLLLAIIVLSTTVVAFPLLLDRDVGAVAAIQTSARAVIANPLPMAAWGLIVAAAVVAGSLPLLAGLAVVMPILGHATWHLYRKVVDVE